MHSATNLSSLLVVIRALPAPFDVDKREQLIDAASMFDDELAMLFLEGEPVPDEMLRGAIRTGVLRCDLVPVFCGSALVALWWKSPQVCGA